MEKKKYINPVTKVIKTDVEAQMLAASSPSLASD